ncbi:PREDICTED: RNA polymerase II subunit A C-terminal domain phosphatase [Chrysochloris asiatica]|uniref:RNA polymerase II subunit A C-terminal domain phosphatase n=1 Tax=Chrysochloris asiatica TaxID=185453 RepID=A0A9B0X112_CHRAS|nr:PREDICTED: RNA polymerase II subunit A C-terminal domain phosphatase [Chrysochloris asiatica]
MPGFVVPQLLALIRNVVGQLPTLHVGTRSPLTPEPVTLYESGYIAYRGFVVKRRPTPPLRTYARTPPPRPVTSARSPGSRAAHRSVGSRFPERELQSSRLVSSAAAAAAAAAARERPSPPSRCDGRRAVAVSTDAGLRHSPGIFHFQLGRGEPMLHTRLRPHCKEFLEKVARLYELHVFTFGSRLYAHTIAGFLDPEKKLFSHRILSRDECIDPFSKTGNLRNLFPCGDSMVCIIDDREDVWKFAPNLITVKKYVYFQGTGDINAPPVPRDTQMRKKVNHSSRGAEASEHVLSRKDHEEGKPAPGAEQSNGLGKPPTELNGSKAGAGDPPSGEEGDPSCPPPGGKGPLVSSEPGGRVFPEQPSAHGAPGNDLDFDLSSDSESNSELDGHRSSSSTSDSDSDRKRGRRKAQATREGVTTHSGAGTPPSGTCGTSVRPQDKGPDLEAPEEGEQGDLCDLGNGCADRKEAETESQNSEQSGITVGESLDQSMEEEEEEEDTDDDDDDHLVHLEEILVRVHTDYYTRYDRYLSKETEEAPDIRKIVPELKSKVLADVGIIFSGLHPTNFPVEKTREHYHATALGARILTNLVLSPDDPNRATHLIAARAGTEKVRQAQECRYLHVVNPGWLWSCLERWDKVEEQLFPLRDDYTRTQREASPAPFADRQSTFQTALFHPTPVHPRSQPGPEARVYDANTGKLIRKGTPRTPLAPYTQVPAPPTSLPAHGEHSFRVVQPPQQQMFGEELPANPDEERPGPSRRKRQPSMSETMPLYTLCKEDLESMDKETEAAPTAPEPRSPGPSPFGCRLGNGPQLPWVLGQFCRRCRAKAPGAPDTGLRREGPNIGQYMDKSNPVVGSQRELFTGLPGPPTWTLDLLSSEICDTYGSHGSPSRLSVQLEETWESFTPSAVSSPAQIGGVLSVQVNVETHGALTQMLEGRAFRHEKLELSDERCGVQYNPTPHVDTSTTGDKLCTSAQYRHQVPYRLRLGFLLLRRLGSDVFFPCVRGHKRKLNEEDAASDSSKESSNEEGSSSEADEMAAALEAELSDFM